MTGALAVLVDVFGAQAARHHEIDLHGAAPARSRPIESRRWYSIFGP
jgi:hypothetical protein